MDSRKKVIHTYVSEELAEKLTRLATADGVSVSTMVGTLISRALSHAVPEDKQDKEKEKLTRTYATVTYVRFLLEELAMATTDPTKALALLAKAKERSGAVSVKREKEVPNG